MTNEKIILTTLLPKQSKSDHRDFILSSVLPRMVPGSRITELQEDGCTIIPFMDLGVSFYVSVKNTVTDSFFMTITDKILSALDIPADELYRHAVEHVDSGYEISRMSDVLNGFVPTSSRHDDCGLFVASNADRLFGASAMLSQKMLDEVADVKGDSFVVLPSSIHEVLIAPYKPDDLNRYLEIVRFVNHTEVSDSDFLADSLYIYKDGSLSPYAE